MKLSPKLPGKLKVLGSSTESVVLKNRAYGAKPSQAEIVNDVKDNHRAVGPKLRLAVTEKTKRRRIRKELMRIQKKKKMKILDMKREMSHQTKTKIKVELLDTTEKS